MCGRVLCDQKRGYDVLKCVLSVTLLVVFSIPAQAQIAFDSASSGEVINGTSVSYSHTITGSSVLLVVGVHVLSSTELLNAPTYNGTAMTLIDKVYIGGQSQWVYQYALANAPQGSHTLSVTTTSAITFGVVSASYTGVAGLPADNSTTQWTPVGESPISATTTLTPNTNNTWTILVGAAGGPPIGAGSGSTLRVTSGEYNWWPYADRLGIFDSNGPINPAASYSMTVTGQQPYTEFGTVMASYAAAQTTSGPLPKIYSQNLQYLGGFRVPTNCGSDHLGFGGDAIAFSPTGNNGQGSLYISSRGHNVAEISIPTPVDSATVGNLNTATCLPNGNFVEPTEGVKSQGDTSTDDSQKAQPTGMAVVDGKLWINNGVYYDAGAAQDLYLMSRPLNLSTTGQVKGLYGLTSAQSGFIPSMASTQVAEISSDWSTAMGGNLFLSKFNKPVITSQSYGPNAIVAKTSILAGASQTTYPAEATPLFFPGNHPLTDNDDGAQTGHVYTTFSQAHSGGSLVQPKGTSSLLVFQVAGATRGTSAGGYGFGYGCGCSDPTVTPGQLSCPSGTDPECLGHPHYYDPERSTDKGTHGYPYVYQVAAFDMEDLAAVVAGTKQPWEPDPYTYWEFTFPISPVPSQGHQHVLSNATYDQANNRIYIAQLKCCDWYGLDPKPIIHVFQVNPQ